MRISANGFTAPVLLLSFMTSGATGDFDDLVSDLRQMIEIAKVETLREDVFVAGLSMGGLLALDYSIKYGDTITGVICSAPAVKLKNPPGGIEYGAARFIAALFPWLTTPNRIPYEWLTHDAALIEETKADKNSQRVISFGLFLQMTKAMRFVFDNAGGIKVPLLFLQGSDDKVVEADGVRELFEKIPSIDKELKVYDGLYHELLRETRREEIAGYIIDWIQKRTGERK
ncbi:MAG: alpha/beta fold hydrolase [Candidatus Omnitrophota bacterium]